MHLTAETIHQRCRCQSVGLECRHVINFFTRPAPRADRQRRVTLRLRPRKHREGGETPGWVHRGAYAMTSNYHQFMYRH